MTIKEWTLWSVPIAIALIALLFAIFAYFNKRGRCKTIVVKKSIAYGLFITFAVYAFGLLTVVEWEPKEVPATKKDISQLKYDILNTLSKPTQQEVENEIDRQFKDEFAKKKKRALEKYQKGINAFNGNKFKIAISHFEGAIEIFAIPSFYILRGISYVLINQFDKAISDYDKAIELKPDYAEAYNNRGITWFQKEITIMPSLIIIRLLN